MGCVKDFFSGFVNASKVCLSVGELSDKFDALSDKLDKLSDYVVAIDDKYGEAVKYALGTVIAEKCDEYLTAEPNEDAERYLASIYDCYVNKLHGNSWVQHKYEEFLKRK